MCFVLAIRMVLPLVACSAAAGEPPPRTMPRIRAADGGKGFVLAGTDRGFVPWGFNYLGQHGRLAEDDWHTPAGWRRIETDFREMRKLGVNVVRWHLQFETFMQAPDRPDAEQLARLKRLLKLARSTGLYLNLTGLNCFRLKRIPPWYDALSQVDRWKAQAVFWDAVAKTCAGDAVLFCYDLMNEPVVTKPKEGDHPWVTGELGGFHFVQRISHGRDGRDSKAIAAAWVKLLVGAIRRHDKEALTTVGVIPWAFVWPDAKPVFYSPQALRHLDVVSIHVYPKPGRLDQELKALAVYDLGKPLVIEETFPLRCSIDELDTFIDAASPRVDGWIAHYFGRTIAEHRASTQPHMQAVAHFLEYWRDKQKQLTQPSSRQ